MDSYTSAGCLGGGVFWGGLGRLSRIVTQSLIINVKKKNYLHQTRIDIPIKRLELMAIHCHEEVLESGR